MRSMKLINLNYSKRVNIDKMTILYIKETIIIHYMDIKIKIYKYAEEFCAQNLVS